MTPIGQRVRNVRSKNAGPFWLTIDIFFHDRQQFDELAPTLDSAWLARALSVPASDIQRYELPELGVLKCSFPRPVVQGSRGDRDMHGAQWAHLIKEAPL